LIFKSNVLAQNYLFKTPRRDGFKFMRNDDLDVTNFQHFVFSGMLAVGFYKTFAARNIQHAKLKAGLLSCGLGLMKEFEDGYREGWGRMDTFFNQLGIISFLLLADYSHFTLGIEPIYTSPDDYGLGLRFFHFNEVTPLRASVGFFGVYNNHNQPWIGIDGHFVLLGKSEVHLGLAMVNLERATELDVRPNIGVSFVLF
jgi:hypothetical protein